MKRNLAKLLVVLVWFGTTRRQHIVQAIPKRGNERWTLILCKFLDDKFEVKPREWFRQWIHSNRMGAIGHYFETISNGMYTIRGSNILGWLTIPMTRRQIQHQPVSIASGPSIQHRRFYAQLAYLEKARKLCTELATGRGKLFSKRIIILNGFDGALYSRTGGVLLTPRLLFSSALAHEMVHSFFIGHSYSDRNITIFPFARRGEYDDRYDLMSTSNAYMHQSTFGLSGPGLTGPHLDFLGWLPSSRVLFLTSGANSGDNVYRLSSLSVPHKRDQHWLLILIPYDTHDTGNVFSIELRTPVQYDSGIKQSAVIIHKIERVGGNYFSKIITHSGEFNELIADTEWVHFTLSVTDNNSIIFPFIKVRVETIDWRQHFADIRISWSNHQHFCHHTESITIDEQFGRICNLTIGSQFLRTRQALNQNVQTYGMNACVNDHVWRRIDPYDYVCVPVQRLPNCPYRSILQRYLRFEEIEKGIRLLATATSSPTNCSWPSVWRQAFIDDQFCTTETDRMMVLSENRNAQSKLRHSAFFNGNDQI